MECPVVKGVYTIAMTSHGEVRQWCPTVGTGTGFMESPQRPENLVLEKNPMTEEWSSDRRGKTNDRFYFNPKKEERMPCKVFVEKNGQVHEETSEVEYKYTPTPSTVHVELKFSA